MKKNLFLMLLSLACSGFTTPGKRADAPRQKYYYFCLSREVPADESRAGKRRFVYTDIRAITGDETDMRRLTGQFATFIEKQCKPGNELCTSDLNYYPDRQQAEKQHKEMIATYKRAGQYTVRRIDVAFD